MYWIGFDIGSSSIKAALVSRESGNLVHQVMYPDREMKIAAPHPGWAEQDPDTWWDYTCRASRQLLAEAGVAAGEIVSIGIAYQMHGLVLVDKAGKVLRPSIIWCDSRAVEIGEAAFQALGEQRCLRHLLNSPGNFTASKLKWVQDNEPRIYEQIHKILLPGDYIALKMTGRCTTTVSGLSEAILWDFQADAPANFLMDYFTTGIDLIPERVPTFGEQGTLLREAAASLGLQAGTPLTYRAGDQPNNALSLNVFQPGEIAATGGTSGVVYGIADKPVFDPESRVNGFAHVNHTVENPRIGVLLCINGTGIQHNWMRQQLRSGQDGYTRMEALAATVAPGSDGLRVHPFGNGAERMLGNRDIGAKISGLHFNRHQEAHLIRAGLEGIAFAFVYGMEIMQDMKIVIRHMRVGNDNLFQSRIFSETIATLMDCRIDMMNTSGAAGAAKAAAVALGQLHLHDFGHSLIPVREYTAQHHQEILKESYQEWKAVLHDSLNKL